MKGTAGMDKIEFQNVVIEVIEFETEDVVTASYDDEFDG